MARKKCPSCGKQSEGNFCSWCGGSLGDVRCPSCGAEAEPGGRFCNMCGAPLAAAQGAAKAAAQGAAGRSAVPPTAAQTGPGSSKFVWLLGAALVMGIVLAITIPTILHQQRTSAAGAPAAPSGVPGGGAPAAGGGMPDLSQMTPRQAADRLFERIMRTSAAGDSASAAFFLPMGIDAYRSARPLDADGLFHLSLLHRMAGDPDQGLEVAREALAAHPTHLLNLAAAGGAAAELGDTVTARDYYAKLLESWDAEMAKGLPEYEAHVGLMPELRRDAESLVGS